MPYFFKDRDYDLTKLGSRKRIFHLVKEHTRRDGAVVKQHYRGQRQFSWAGYDVKITVPGEDHFRIENMSVGTIDSEAAKMQKERKRNLITTEELGRRLRNIMDGASPDAEFKD
jgi:hypothetical protein